MTGRLVIGQYTNSHKMVFICWPPPKLWTFWVFGHGWCSVIGQGTLSQEKTLEHVFMLSKACGGLRLYSTYIPHCRTLNFARLSEEISFSLFGSNFSFFFFPLYFGDAPHPSYSRKQDFFFEKTCQYGTGLLAFESYCPAWRITSRGQKFLFLSFFFHLKKFCFFQKGPVRFACDGSM